jgi:DNA primase
MISPRTIEQVTDAARIEEVVGDFVALKRRGSSMQGLCPFHNEKTPSFNVSPARGIYKCFGCGKAGNSVRFIMDHEKLSYPEAIRYLAKKYQINVEEENQTEEVKEELRERESMLLLNEWAASHMETLLHEDETGRAIGLSYFKERGFTEDTIRKFRLGFLPDQWAHLTDSAIREGYQKEFLVKTGLSIEREDGRMFDRFKNRVMFPIQNLSGRVIGFGGRILTNDKKQAKYLNSPESEVYHKSAVLYGIYHSRKSISELDEALLVEGYTDVISLHQAGIENVVASSGTSLTNEQVRMLRRYTENVTILYDGDAAGIKASFRGLDMILEQGLNVKIVLFPDGEDPDSFARKNSPVFIKDYIQSEARNFIEFKTSILAEEAGNDPIRKAGMIREIIGSLALIPDPVLRSLYLKECSSRLGMDEQTLIFELNKQIKSKQERRPPSNFTENSGSPAPFDAPPDDLFGPDGPVDPQIKQDVSGDYRVDAQEKDLIRILVKYANQLIYFDELNEEGEKVEYAHRVGDFILSELEADQLLPENPAYLKLYHYFLARSQEDYPEDPELLNHPDEVISTTVIDLTTDKYVLSDLWKNHHQIFITMESDLLKKGVLEAVYSFKMRHVVLMKKALVDELNRLGNDDGERMDEILEEIKLLQSAKDEFSKRLNYN